MAKEYKPEWVKKLETWGKKSEYNWDRKKDRKAEYVFTIIINAIFIAFWSWLPNWLPFLTDSFSAVLPLFYVSFAASIIGNILLILADPPLFRASIRSALNLIGVAVMITLYYVFPFDFSAYTSANWELIIRILIIVGIIGTAIGTVVEFITGLVRQVTRKD